MKEGFTDTEEDFDWLDDDDGSKLLVFKSEALRDGYSLVPDDHPVGIPGFDYRFHGPLAYYKQQ